jgi:hypothetical protein
MLPLLAPSFIPRGAGPRHEHFVLAYMWLNLAAAATPQNALVSMGNDIAKQRDQLDALMTQEQVAEAQRLSREWKPHKE